LESQAGKRAAYGIFPVDAPLDQIVSSLHAAGFETSTICVFLPPSHPVANEVRNVKSSAEERVGDRDNQRVIAWLATLGGVVIPEVGFFVGARGYLHAVACGICETGDRHSGTLERLGIPADTAERYATRTREDATLVFVTCDGWAQSEWAREILRLLRAGEVCVLGENEADCDPPALPSNVVVLRQP
jgi:hypothetical protein